MTRLQIVVYEYDRGIDLDLSSRAIQAKMSRGKHGDLRLDVAARMDRDEAWAFYTLAGTPRVEVNAGPIVLWSGRAEKIRVRGGNLTIGALGQWRATADLKTYTALWSDASYAEWEPMTSDDLATVTEAFKSDNNNRIYVVPQKGGEIALGDGGGRYYRIPDSSSRNMTVVQYTYEVVGSSKWMALLRRWAGVNFATPTTIWSPTLSSYGTYTGAVFATLTGSPLLSFELQSQVAETTLGTAINAVDTTLAPSSLQVNTTSGTAVGAPGTVTITPASMTNIVNGMKLLYDAGTSALEKVTVSNVTGTTFDATFKAAHSSGCVIKSVDDWAVPEVDTSTTAGYAAGVRTITPSSMANIVAGMTLIIGWAGEAEEEVTVSSITSTTFNCTLIYGHASGEKIKNGLNTYTVRPQSMTGIIAGVNLDIGGRNSEMVNVASVTSTTFTAAFQYGHPGDSTVTTAKRQTVTPASMTDIAVGREYRIGNEAGASGGDVEKVTILEVTASTFTADFTTPHGSTDSVKRIYTGDYDAWLKITNLRIATTIANMVDTTIGSNITAGNRTVTPASMANIYVGQQLVIDSAGVGDTGEIVTVTAIAPTTFTAIFAINHTATITVKGIVVYGDEVVADVLSVVNGMNPDQLSDSTILIESPGVDMVDAVYLDRVGMTVIEDIAQRGDAEGNAWETGVYDDVLYLRPLGDDALSWAVDAEIELERDITQLANEVKAVHKHTDEKLKRTSAANDLASSEKYGLVRQAAVDVHTTRPVEAEAVRDVVLATKADPPPRVSLDFDLIFSEAGSPAEKFLQKAGDVLIARNTPPTMDVPPDNSASFRLSRVDYDVLKDGLQVEVESISLVNKLAGVGVDTNRPVVNGQRKPFLIAATG